MSRCFPFPPPGYEKRARVDDTDLLKKRGRNYQEKQEEKRSKKDKKDKERREGKEKEDKETKKGKEKKDKEKKNGKEKKDKEKREGKEKKGKEKREHKEKKDKERGKEKHGDKKDRKEEQKDKDREKDKEKKWASDKKKVVGQPDCDGAEKLVPNNHQNIEIKDVKYVEELSRRIRDEERATESQVVQKIGVTGQKGSEFLGVVDKNIAKWPEEKKKIKVAKEDGRQVNGQRNPVNTRSLDSFIGGNFPVMDNRRDEGLATPVEKEKPIDGKERNEYKESDVKVDKHKDKDREKKSKSKSKGEAKGKKKGEKVGGISQQSKQQPKLQEIGSESLDSCNAKQFYHSGISDNNSVHKGSLGKRKELDKNGLLLDNGIRPHKLPRPVSCSEGVVENGRKLEPCETDIPSTSGRQGAASNGEVDIKDHTRNGLVGPQRPNAYSMRSSSNTVPVTENGEASSNPPLIGPQRPSAWSTKPSIALQVDDNGEAFSKPPHPDAKYLSRILSMPKVEELSDMEDQEWLFNSGCVGSKEPKVGFPEVEGTQNVWSEALRIDSADVYALPYVIPY